FISPLFPEAYDGSQVPARGQKKFIVNRAPGDRLWLHAFRHKITPARNRVITHLNRESVLQGQQLGGALPLDKQVEPRVRLTFQIPAAWPQVGERQQPSGHRASTCRPRYSPAPTR